MITHHRHWRALRRALLSGLIIISVNSALLSSSACSRGKSSTEVADTTDTGDIDTTPVTPTTNTTTTNTGGQVGQNGQLFDTDLNGNEKQWNTGQLNSGGQMSQTEQSCLSNSFGGSSYDGEENYSQGCVNPNQSGARVPLSQNTFYNSTLSTYEDLDQCLATALSRTPQNDQEARIAHRAGRMYLARCYQQVVQRMQSQIPWGNHARQNFQHAYNNVGVLLVNFHIID